MKERFDLVNDKKRSEPEEKQDGVTRRSFLRAVMSGAASGVVTTALSGEAYLRLPDFEIWAEDRDRRMRFEHWSGLSPEEREKAITIEVERARAFIGSSEGKRILEDGTDDEIFSLLMSLPALLREHIAGTSYDVPKERWPSVVIGFSAEGNPLPLDTGHGIDAIKGRYGGNAVFVAANTLLTNLHVAAYFLASTNNQEVSHIQELFGNYHIDATYLHVDDFILETQTNGRTILPLSELSNAGIEGNLITVAGIDPDASAASDGTKIYPSVAIPMTRRLGRFLVAYGNYTELDRNISENGFMYIAPPGESAWRPLPSNSGSRLLDLFNKIDQSKREALLQGTSGSPVLMNGELVGLNHRLGNLQYKGVGLDVGFFHGPEALRKAKEVGMELHVSSSQRGNDSSRN